MTGALDWDLPSQGKAAALLRSFEGNNCPLGRWSAWAAALKMVLHLAGDSRHPVLVLWGSEHRCFFNDAYEALGVVDDVQARYGQPGRDVLASYWSLVEPQLQAVLGGEGSTWHENQLIPLERDGRSEPRFYTYSYSPIRDPKSPRGIGGVLVLCQETTALVRSEQRLEQERAQWQRLFDQAPTFNAILRGPEHRYIYANAAYLRVVHRSDAILGKSVAEALPEVVSQGFVELLDQVYATSEAYEGRSIPVQLVDESGAMAAHYVDFIFQPIRDNDGRVSGIFIQGHDVTGRWTALQQAEESERRLRVALQAAAMGAWTLDSEGQLDLDPRAAEVLRAGKRGRVALSALLDAALPAERDRAKSAFAAAAVSSEGFDVPLTLQDAGAEPRYVRLVGGREVASTGVQSIAGVVFDVSQEVRLQKSRSQSLKRLELAKRAADLGVHVWHIASGALEWDARTRELFGVADDEPLTFQTFTRLLHPDDEQATLRAVERALQPDGDGRYAAEYRVVPPGHAVRWVRATGEVAFLDGTPSMMTGTVQDITASKLTEAALIDADRRKDAFLATLSHELRNPLTPIRTAATLLGLPQASSQDKHKAQRIIERQTGHMARLLDDLLDVARITRGKLTIHPERVALHSLVEVAVETANPVINEKSHQLIVSVPKETIWVDADPVRFAQVVANLLINAAKYTPSAGHIQLAVQQLESAVSVRVQDDGIGLAPEQLDRVFSMFWQAEQPERRQGLGVGLALVKGLIQLHGGTVEARSAGLGRGSEFIVTLPLARATRTADSIPTVATSTGRAVLVVDDNIDAADTLGAFLQHQGHEVAVAYDGKTALKTVESFTPEVCFLDIGLPDMTGYLLAQRLRDRLPQAEFAAITGWGRQEDQAKARAAGFRWHLTKPFDTNDVTLLLAGKLPAFAPSRL